MHSACGECNFRLFRDNNSYSRVQSDNLYLLCHDRLNIYNINLFLGFLSSFFLAACTA